MKYYRCNNCKKIESIEDIEGIKKCNSCNSEDIMFVTKEYVDYYKSNELNNKKLLKKAKVYLEDKDYKNAYCFANASNIDNEKSYNGYIIKVLAYYKVNKIEDLSSLKEDLEESEDFKCAISFANEKQKNNLIKVFDKNQDNIKKIKYREANKLLKDSNIDNLSNACRIFSSLEDYKDSKKRLAICRKKFKSQYEVLENKRKNDENIKVVAVASIILVIIIMTLLIIHYC